MSALSLKPQEIPFDHRDSTCMFVPRYDMPFVATTAALERFGNQTILDCLCRLQQIASENQGLDYLQVFESHGEPSLWFIEDGPGGAITALLSSDY
jgi:hypothetical protein